MRAFEVVLHQLDHAAVAPAARVVRRDPSCLAVIRGGAVEIVHRAPDVAAVDVAQQIIGLELDRRAVVFERAA